MADIESISHCGVLAADTRELAETMEAVLGSQRLVTGERAYANRRGGAPHPHEMVGDFMMVTFPYPSGWTVPPPGQLRGRSSRCHQSSAGSGEQHEHRRAEVRDPACREQSDGGRAKSDEFLPADDRNC